MKKSIILLRGLPGSGKTSLAEVLNEGGKYPHFSVDDYFTDQLNGEYEFAFDKNHLAYKQCELNTENAMRQGAEKIFIHNTFTLEWEMLSYFRLASKYQYDIYVITIENRHHSTNTHGISQDQVIKMAAKYKVVLF